MAKAKKKVNPTKRILVIIGILLGVFIVGAVGGKALGIIGSGGKGPTVETAVAELRDVTQLVTASGRLQPETEVKISPDVSGEIIYLGVEEGMQVSKGDLLIRIRSDFYAAQIEKAKAGVSQARAGQARAEADKLKAELDMTRVKELYDRNVVPESEFDQARTTLDITKANLDAAQFQVEAAEAGLAEAEENLAKTNIYSPMTGTISMLSVEFGERVVGTLQMAGTEMLRIARLDQMEMEAEVNENDVVNISLGDTARIEVDAYPNRPFKGIVTEIANSARITAQGTQEQITNFPVKVRILDPHNVDKLPGNTRQMGTDKVTSEEVAIPTEDVPQFRPGMSSTVDIFTDFEADVVTVPIQSVAVRDFARLGEDDAESSDRRGPPRSGDEEGDDTDAGQPDGSSEVGEEEDLRKVVFVVSEGEVEMVEVETGISDASNIEITSGLAGGEEVVTGPYSAVSRTLEDGSPVQTKDGSNR